VQNPAPPFDPELAALLKERGLPAKMNIDQLIRSRTMPRVPSIDEVVATRDLSREDRVVPGLDGDPTIVVTMFKRRDHGVPGLGIYYVHGGGMVGGDRFTGVDRALDWVQLFDAVAVSVEYRLAPEHPDPAPVRDCYAGVLWAATHAEELGFNADQLIILGGSAGGGLAAGATLMARDRGGPTLAAQILIGPMLDDRNESLSSHQIDGIGVWDRGSNETGWDALLGHRRGTDEVTAYAAPARATDLSGLPPSYIDVGSAEVFRDEAVAYASRIWAAGGSADLHVWGGAHHGFDTIFPEAVLSRRARQSRTEYIRRLFNVADTGGAS
jgi:acetyl esterase/lipase